MKTPKSVRLDIMMGLPGSGKTTYANKLYEESKSQAKLYSLDEMKKEHPKADIADVFCQALYYSTNKSRFIVDGLILTNDDLANIIEVVADRYICNVYIYHWNEDRETCLKNDGGRREDNSSAVILHAKYDTVDVDYIKEKLSEYNVVIQEVVEKKVKLKPDWELYFRKVGVRDGVICSQEWCTGGAYGNCWDNSMSSINPDEPCDFDELDNLLMEICPNVTFLQYKKIKKNCVSIAERYERQYYGGGIHYSHWECDLSKLYASLKELNIIVEGR